MHNLLEVIRLHIMGEQDQRDANGIWYEKQPRVEAVKDGQHCYGFSNMVEKPRSSEAPPASMKIVDNKLDEVQTVVRDTLQVRFNLWLNFRLLIWVRSYQSIISLHGTGRLQLK